MLDACRQHVVDREAEGTVPEPELREPADEARVEFGDIPVAIRMAG